VSIEVLELEGDLEWNKFIRSLRKEGITLSEEEDVLTWSWKKDERKPRTKLVYDVIFETHINVQGE
jgi:DNA-binding transcriptional MerR regulator